MLYDGSEEQSNLNTNDTFDSQQENMGAEEQSNELPNVSNEPDTYEPNLITRTLHGSLTDRDQAIQTQAVKDSVKNWWEKIPMEQADEFFANKEKEYRDNLYVSKIMSQVDESLRYRGITNLINVPLTRSLQAGIDKTVGGIVQFAGSAWDFAARNSENSALTQWGADITMRGNYMSNWTQRQYGDANRWEDVNGVGSFLAFTGHMGAELAPLVVSWESKLFQGAGWVYRAGKAYTATKLAAGIVEKEAIATTGEILAKNTLDMIAKNGGKNFFFEKTIVNGATKAEQGIYAKSVLSPAAKSTNLYKVNSSEIIKSINTANAIEKQEVVFAKLLANTGDKRLFKSFETFKPIASKVPNKSLTMQRLAAQSPVAFKFGAKAYGALRQDLVNSGMSTDEATYKSFVAALPQAAFGYMPSFGTLNPSAFRFMGEMATMGGVNVLMNPIQAMVNYPLGLDKPRDGETYWDYLYRHTTENMMEPFVIGAVFHLMSLHQSKFSDAAKLDRQRKQFESIAEEIRNNKKGAEESSQKPDDDGTTVIDTSDNNNPPPPNDGSEGVIDESKTTVANTELEKPEVSIEEIYQRRVINNNKNENVLDATIEHSDGTTENVQVLPSTHVVDSEGSRIETVDGKVVETENIKYQPKTRISDALQKELDILQAKRKEIQAIYDAALEQKKATGQAVADEANIKGELSRIDMAIRYMNNHMTLNESFGRSNNDILRALFGEDFSPTVHGQAVLDGFARMGQDLSLLSSWLDSPEGAKLKASIPDAYQKIQDNLKSLREAYLSKKGINGDIYSKIDELYGLLGDENVDSTIRINKIKDEITQLYESLKTDYELPHNMDEYLPVVNQIKTIHALNAMLQTMGQMKDKSTSGKFDFEVGKQTITQEVTLNGIKYNLEFNIRPNESIKIKPTDVNRLRVKLKDAKEAKEWTDKEIDKLLNGRKSSELNEEETKKYNNLFKKLIDLTTQTNTLTKSLEEATISDSWRQEIYSVPYSEKSSDALLAEESQGNMVVTTEIAEETSSVGKRYTEAFKRMMNAVEIDDGYKKSALESFRKIERSIMDSIIRTNSSELTSLAQRYLHIVTGDKSAKILKQHIGLGTWTNPETNETTVNRNMRLVLDKNLSPDAVIAYAAELGKLLKQYANAVNMFADNGKLDLENFAAIAARIESDGIAKVTFGKTKSIEIIDVGKEINEQYLADIATKIGLPCNIWYHNTGDARYDRYVIDIIPSKNEQYVDVSKEYIESILEKEYAGEYTVVGRDYIGYLIKEKIEKGEQQYEKQYDKAIKNQQTILRKGDNSTRGNRDVYRQPNGDDNASREETKKVRDELKSLKSKNDKSLGELTKNINNVLKKVEGIRQKLQQRSEIIKSWEYANKNVYELETKISDLKLQQSDYDTPAEKQSKLKLLESYEIELSKALEARQNATKARDQLEDGSWEYSLAKKILKKENPSEEDIYLANNLFLQARKLGNADKGDLSEQLRPYLYEIDKTKNKKAQEEKYGNNENIFSWRRLPKGNQAFVMRNKPVYDIAGQPTDTFETTETPIDNFALRNVINPIAEFQLAKNHYIKLEKVGDRTYRADLDVKIKEDYKDYIHKTIMINGMKFFILNHPNHGPFELIELTGNLQLDANFVRIETSLQKLNWLAKNVNKEQGYLERLKKETPEFLKYLVKQVDSGMFSIEEAQKVYNRLKVKSTKGLEKVELGENFKTYYEKYKKSENSTKTKNAEELSANKDFAAQISVADFFNSDKGVNAFKEDVLGQITEGKLKDSKELRELFKIADGAIGKDKVSTKSYDNFIKTFRKVKKLYEQEINTNEVINDFISSTNDGITKFEENNENYQSESGEIKNLEASRAFENDIKNKIETLKASLGHWSDIVDSAMNNIAQIKSPKEMNELLGGTKSPEPTILFASREASESSGPKISSEIISDSILSLLPDTLFARNRQPKSHSFGFLSSLIVNKGGQEVFAKTGFMQKTGSRQIKDIGEVFLVGDKYYVVTNIEKLPNLKLNPVTNAELSDSGKFSRTALDVKKFASSKDVGIYFDENGNFRQEYELVSYKLIEGNAQKVTLGMDGKPRLTSFELNNKEARFEYLNTHQFIQNYRQTMKDLKDSHSRTSFGRTLTNETTSLDSLENQNQRVVFSTIGDNKETLGLPKNFNSKPSQPAQQPKPSSMMTDPTAHTASQAIENQNRNTAPTQETAPEPTQPTGTEEPTVSSGMSDPNPTPDTTPQDNSRLLNGSEEGSNTTEETPVSTRNTGGDDNGGGGDDGGGNSPDKPVPPDEYQENLNRRIGELNAAEAEKQKFSLWERFKNLMIADDSPLDTFVKDVEDKIGRSLPDHLNPFKKFSLANQTKNARLRDVNLQFEGSIVTPMKEAFRKYAETRQGMSNKELVDTFMKDFDYFVELRSAPDLNAAYKETIQTNANNPELMSSFIKPMSEVEAQRILKSKKLSEPELYAQFEQIHDTLTNILNKSLSDMVDAGLMKQALYDKLVGKYKYYAPLYVYEDALSSPHNVDLRLNIYNERGAMGVAGLDLAISHRLGVGSKPRGDVLQHAKQMLNKRARAIAHQPAQQTLYNFVKYGIANNLLPKGFVYMIDPEAPNVINQMVESGMSYSEARLIVDGFRESKINKTTIDKDGNVTVREISVPPPADNIVPVNIIESVHPLTGDKQIKKVYLAFDAKNERAMHIAKLYNGTLDIGWMPTGKVGKAYFATLKWWNAMNTGYNPFFAIKNFSADYFDMLTNISNTPVAGKRWEITKRIPEIVVTIAKYNRLVNKYTESGNLMEFQQIVKQDPLMAQYHEYYMNGGSHNFVEDTNLIIGEITENLKKKIGTGVAMDKAKTLLGGIKNLVDIEMNSLENSIRFSSYLEGINSGMSKDSATLLGKDITANFDRKGSAARKINGLWSYTTANIAGQSRVFKSLTGKKGLMLMTGALLAGMAQQSMYDDMDDLESASIPDHIKQQYMVLPSGNGTYIKVRIRGLGFLFQLGRNLSKLSNGDTSTLQTTLDMFNAVSFTGQGGAGFLQTVSPTFVKPAVAIATNESWTGSKIRNEDPQGLTPKWMLGRAGSNPIADNLVKALYDVSGGKIDLSPQDIEYLSGIAAGGAATQSYAFLKSVKLIDKDSDREVTNPFFNPLPVFTGDISKNIVSYVYKADNDFQRIKQIVRKYQDAGDMETAKKLMASAKYPPNDAEIASISKRLHKITEEKNSFVRKHTIARTSHLPIVRKTVAEFNKRQLQLAQEYAQILKRKGY